MYNKKTRIQLQRNTKYNMKFIFTLLFITTLSVFSFSQKNTTSIYGGLNFSTWTGNANGFAENLVEETIDLQWLSKYDYENKFRLGFTIGFNMEFKISGNFYFQPGVSYSQKGTGFKGFNKKSLFITESMLKEFNLKLGMLKDTEK